MITAPHPKSTVDKRGNPRKVPRDEGKQAFRRAVERVIGKDAAMLVDDKSESGELGFKVSARESSREGVARPPR